MQESARQQCDTFCATGIDVEVTMSDKVD